MLVGWDHFARMACGADVRCTRVPPCDSKKSPRASPLHAMVQVLFPQRSTSVCGSRVRALKAQQPCTVLVSAPRSLNERAPSTAPFSGRHPGVLQRPQTLKWPRSPPRPARATARDSATPRLRRLYGRERTAWSCVLLHNCSPPPRTLAADAASTATSHTPSNCSQWLGQPCDTEPLPRCNPRMSAGNDRLSLTRRNRGVEHAVLAEVGTCCVELRR